MLYGVKKEAWMLVSYAVVTAFGISMVFPYIPVYGKEIGIPVSIIGYLVVLFYLLQAITRIPLGRLSDIIGHQRPVMLGAVCYLISSLAFILSCKLWTLLFVGEFFLGIANSITWVTIPSYVTNIRKIIPIYTFSIGVGWLIGPPTGGYIKDELGMEWLFLALFFASLVMLVLSVLFYLESKEVTLKDSVASFANIARFTPTSIPIYPSMKSYLEAWGLIKGNTELMRASLFSFLIFMVFGLGASIVPLYFTEIGITSFLIGILISIRASTSTVIKLASERITRRFGGKKVLTASTVLVGISIILVSLTDSLILIMILSILWGLSSGLYLPVVFNIIGKCTRREERGIAMGVRGTLGTLGAAFGTMVFSNLAQSLTLSSSLFLAGVFAAVGSVILGLLR